VQQIAGYLVKGNEHADGNSQIKAATFFGQFGWCQVDGDAACGEFKVGVDNGAAHTVFAFFDGSFW
jgi:hypothetical protein